MSGSLIQYGRYDRNTGETKAGDPIVDLRLLCVICGMPLLALLCRAYFTVTLIVAFLLPLLAVTVTVPFLRASA